MMIDLVSPDFWPIIPLVPHWGMSHFIWRFMDPHGLVRSSLTGCSSRRGHDRYLTEPLRSIHPGPHFSTLGFHHASPPGRYVFGHVCMIQLWIRTTIVTCSMTDDFMSLDFWPVVHLMPYWGIFPFWRIFIDLRRGHMFEDRWSHAIWSPTYHTFRCHTGAYFGSDEIYRSWGSRVLILIWRDVCRDDDIFAILTMIP